MLMWRLFNPRPANRKQSIMFWTYLIAALILSVALFAWLRPVVWRFSYRIFLLYFAILLASIGSCFGATVTYFSNEGCVVAMRCFNFFCSFWIDISVEVRNAERIALASGPDHNPLVLISNHQSGMDLYVLSEFWPKKCTAMMKKSLKSIPFFNIGAILSNSIFVDRTSKENAQQALDEAIDTMRQKKLKVWIFPEGTRNHQHGLLPFKKGAFNVAVNGHFPIVPVVISDYSPFYSRSNRYFNTGGKVIVQVMEPITTERLSYDHVLELCESVHAKMAKVYEEISAEAANKMKPNNKTS